MVLRSARRRCRVARVCIRGRRHRRRSVASPTIFPRTGLPGSNPAGGFTTGILATEGAKPMQHMELAQRLSLTLTDLESLFKGQPTANVAKRFGVSIMDIQEFTRGTATAVMARRLGLTMAAAEELTKEAGGAGVLIGYMLNM